MKTIKAFPPNYPEIRRAFPHIRGRDIIFAYGDKIFYPSGKPLPDSLIAHETVHGQRQAGDPAGWWKRYLVDASFRFEEELLAHRAEYRAGGDLAEIAKRLSGPLYGANISLDRAREMIVA